VAHDGVIWMRPEGGSRGPRASYTRDDVARAGIALADAEGIDAVSMRRIAAHLGTGTASLYRYVARKDDILELMVDAALGEAPPVSLTGDWPEDLRTLAYRIRDTALRHPWLAPLTAARPTLGPHSLAEIELVLSVFDGFERPMDEILANVGTLIAFVRGHILEELAESDAARRTGLDRQTWMARQSAYGPVVMNSGRYPRVTRMWLEADAPHDPDRLERAFALGLDRVLAGIAATIGRDRGSA